MIMIAPYTQPTRQEIRDLEHDSYVQQFYIHVADIIATQISRFVNDSLPNLPEATRDELVDGFMHTSKEIAIDARDEIIAKISADATMDQKNAVNRISAIRAMHAILNDNYISANFAYYAFVGKIDEVHMLFTPILDGFAKRFIEIICKQSHNKYDSTKLCVAPAMYVADELWGYEGDRTAHTDADPLSIAEQWAARQKAYKQYCENGGILIKQDVLLEFCHQNALRTADSIIDDWFGQQPNEPEQTAGLKEAFRMSNADIGDETDSPIVNAALSLFQRDYDACGKGLTEVFGGMSHLIANSRNSDEMIAMQNNFARAAQSLYALHQIFHDPGATFELARYCRVNGNNPDQFPILQQLHFGDTSLLSTLKSSIRANCADNGLVRDTIRQLRADEKRAARRQNKVEEPQPEPVLWGLVRAVLQRTA